MRELKNLFTNNQQWVQNKLAADPNYFKKLSRLQAAKYLWIGCSDSRMPPNELVGLKPGELFVHRNVANLVIHTDINCLSVIQFAVEKLKVRHIIVCGHYHCGGIKTALQPQKNSIIDNWLRNVKDIYFQNFNSFEKLSLEKKWNLLCELNVKEQVKNVAATSIVQQAWAKKQPLTIHGWIYDIASGLINDTKIMLNNKNHLHSIYHQE